MVAKSDETSETAPRARIFISYSRKDMPFADRLDAALKARDFEPIAPRFMPSRTGGNASRR
jgi:hypothetical protein